jgi:hypothetical protein
VKSEGYWPR